MEIPKTIPPPLPIGCNMNTKKRNRCPQCDHENIICGKVVDHAALNPRRAVRFTSPTNGKGWSELIGWEFSACCGCGFLWTYTNTENLSRHFSDTLALPQTCNCLAPKIFRARLLPFDSDPLHLRSFKLFRPNGASIWNRGLVDVRSNYTVCIRCGILSSSLPLEGLLAALPKIKRNNHP